MNKEIADKWVAALRSGKYSQTIGRLCADTSDEGQAETSYCCLGVLCDLHSKETGKGEWFGYCYRCDSGNGFEVPPDEVVAWAGMKDANPVYTTKPIANNTIAQLNDNAEWSFGWLADLIERHWEKL